MRFLKDLTEGSRIGDIYLIKSKTSAVTKNGKNYLNVILQDKTGVMDAKVWEPNSAGIDEFSEKDYVEIVGDVNVFNGSLQVSVKRARVAKEGEYDPKDYLPVTQKDIDGMYMELTDIIEQVGNTYLKALLKKFFMEDENFMAKFRFSSAAKTVHHAFVGGLLEHTLSVTKNCLYFAGQYRELNKDLLVTAAICHDIGKTKELSAFPDNEYTDDGCLIGHIVMGSEMVSEKAAEIPGFPPVLLSELKHCILAHHGEFEYGSPKKPALIEAVALNFADDIDAKMETFAEILGKSNNPKEWQGYSKLLDSNIRGTRLE